MGTQDGHLLSEMYSKNQVYLGDFGDFKGLYMKFHIDFADAPPYCKNIYEKSSTFQVFDRQTSECTRKIE